MSEHRAAIPDIPLFASLPSPEIPRLLHCFEATEHRCKKDMFIFHEGDRCGRIGAVLSGSISIVSIDFWGNRSIIEKIGAGRLFAETIAFSSTDTLPFSVMAAEESVLMFLNSKKIAAPCSRNCGYHPVIINNMLKLLADKNIMLAQKIDHISKRTTKEKLMSYLSIQSVRTGSSTFTIPFNRQELADYLSVDRSAMSAELGRLRQEGILDFRKNHFHLFKEEG